MGGFLDFLHFGLKEARACVFAGSFFVLLFVSTKLDLGPLARYDFLFIAAVVLQLGMILVGLETWREALAISVFHLVGLGLELFKTSPGVASWSYPEACLLRVGTVPLYAGFMYAAVGSYIMQSWSVLDLRFRPFPPKALGLGLCALIYANFFTNHWIMDLRWILMALVALVYVRTMVEFRPRRKVYRMPLLLAFVLIAFFIWVAENLATYLGAWAYPDQSERWNWVSPAKISSWALLVIISFIIVAISKQGRPRSSGPVRRRRP